MTGGCQYVHNKGCCKIGTGFHRNGVQCAERKDKNEEKKTDEVMQEMIKAYAIKIGKPDDMILRQSGGNQQKVIIAKWIGNHPEILGYEICNGNSIYKKMLLLK